MVKMVFRKILRQHLAVQSIQRMNVVGPGHLALMRLGAPLVKKDRLAPVRDQDALFGFLGIERVELGSHSGAAERQQEWDQRESGEPIQGSCDRS